MKTIAYRTIDKSSWPRGAWDDEPDKKQWQDTATGLPCLIVRNGVGALCGYVGVPRWHPWHGRQYGDCVQPDPCGDPWSCEHPGPPRGRSVRRLLRVERQHGARLTVRRLVGRVSHGSGGERAHAGSA
jgi:hypothetical protein